MILDGGRRREATTLMTTDKDADDEDADDEDADYEIVVGEARKYS